ncbi:MAG: hypothetical protein QXP55_01765 [Nitrososphaerales archaeon]
MIDSTWALVFATIGLILATLIYAYYTRKQAKLLRNQLAFMLYSFAYDRTRGVMPWGGEVPTYLVVSMRKYLQEIRKVFKELGLD